MSKDKKINLILVALILALAGGLFWQRRAAEKPVEPPAGSRSAFTAAQAKSERQKGIERARARRTARKVEPSAREKPALLELAEDDEAKLNEFSRQILRELQEALDSEDFAVVSRLVKKMLEIPPDPKFGAEGVHELLRRKGVEALGWFGSQAMPELVGMLADTDPEIREATFDQFSLALEDISLSDYERADIVAMAAKVLHDVDNLEMLLMEVNNMRHSVGAGTLVEICLEGTPEAQSLMPEAIEFFTGEDSLQTVEDVERWLAENPDGPDDDDLYGGDSDDPDAE